MAPSSTNGEGRRPTISNRQTAPVVMTMNSHFATADSTPTREQYEHGVQVIDSDKNFK